MTICEFIDPDGESYNFQSKDQVKQIKRIRDDFLPFEECAIEIDHLKQGNWTCRGEYDDGTQFFETILYKAVNEQKHFTTTMNPATTTTTSFYPTTTTSINTPPSTKLHQPFLIHLQQA